MTCQDLTEKIKIISNQVQDFDIEWAEEPKNVVRLLELQDEIQKHIAEIKKELPPESVWINGKEFPVEVLETTGKTGPQLIAEAEGAGINFLSDTSKFMCESPEFVVSRAGEKIPIVRLGVRDIFSDDQNHPYGQIIAKAKELGLDFLPHETGIDLLLKEETQPKLNEYLGVFSEPISDKLGRPGIFGLTCESSGFRLYYYWAIPENGWNYDNELAFRLRPSAPLGAGNVSPES